MKAGARLGGLDAAFFYMDSPLMVNEVAGLSIFDGPFDFETYVDHIEHKLDYLPRMRQFPAFVPFDIGYPTWEFDPHFDIRNHVRHCTLEAPGTREQLQALATKLLAERLPRDRPMWRTTVIDGLEDGKSAMFGMMHHSISDGVGLMQMVAMMYDFEPTPYTPDGAMPEWKKSPIPPIPSTMTRLLRAIRDDASFACKLLVRFPRGLFNVIRILRMKSTREGIRYQKEYHATPGVCFPFNTILTGERHFASDRFSIEEMRRIRTACGGTVNDVLLAAVAGAAERYAVYHNVPTEGRNLRLQVPASIRSDDQEGTMGNMVAGFPVGVPCGIANPIERLRTITEKTRRAKELHITEGTAFVLNTSRTAMSPPISALAKRILAWPRFQRWYHRKSKPPMMNMYVSNVAGGDFSVYVMERKLLARYPVSTLLPGMGMACAANSYAAHLYVTFTADTVTAPDPDRMMDFLKESFAELREAAGVEPVSDEYDDVAQAPNNLLPA